MSKSHIKRYTHTDSKGRKVSIPNLYRDGLTGIFYVRINKDGKVKTRSLKTDVFSIARSRISEAIFNIQNEQIKSSNKLLREYKEDLWRTHETKGSSFNTFKRYNTSWNLRLDQYWGNMSGKDITQDALDKFYQWHQKKFGIQLFSDVKILRQIIKLMVADGEVTKLLDFSLPKAEVIHHKTQKGYYISEDEMKSIFENTKEEKYLVIFKIAYATGMRKGEIGRLKKSYLNHKDGKFWIQLPATITKSRRSRVVPLTQSLYESLLRVAGTGQYVFPKLSDPSSHIADQLIDRAWRTAKERAGIKRRIRFHDTRVSCATNLAQAGVDATRASSMLGMSIKMFKDVYLDQEALDMSDLVKDLI